MSDIEVHFVREPYIRQQPVCVVFELVPGEDGAQPLVILSLVSDEPGQGMLVNNALSQGF